MELDTNMSLKAFHIFFIVISILFSLGFAYWSYNMMNKSTDSSYLYYFILSLLLVIGLVFYGINFLKKLKNIQ